MIKLSIKFIQSIFFNFKKYYTLLSGQLIRCALFIPFSVFILGCTQPLSDGLINDHFHSIEWGEDPQHGSSFVLNAEYCKACHGQKLEGGQADVSCIACHHSNNWNGTSHGNEFANTSAICSSCHGDNLQGGIVEVSCLLCHHFNNWEDTSHSIKFLNKEASCKGCHGDDLKGGYSGVSCGSSNSCHHIDFAVPIQPNNNDHGIKFNESSEFCKTCHGTDMTSGGIAGVSCGSLNGCHHEWTTTSDGTHGTKYQEVE
ncbi:MAG: hypothetical protein SVR08_16525, partial [Spirochaetota bacterium]|nr:hypothetical protein [Spirochaetota bacterium]